MADTTPSTLLARIAVLEEALKLAHSAITALDVSGADYARSGIDSADCTQAQCFGGFSTHGTVEARFGEEQAVIGWPDLALARDTLARALQVGGP